MDDLLRERFGARERFGDVPWQELPGAEDTDTIRRRRREALCGATETVVPPWWLGAREAHLIDAIRGYQT